MNLFKKNKQKQMELHNSSTGETPERVNKLPEQVNHPKHYNQYPMEVIDMMIKIFGKEATFCFCMLNAYKYRMRAGHKDDVNQDLSKEQWYLDKAKELEGDEKVKEFVDKYFNNK